MVCSIAGGREYAQLVSDLGLNLLDAIQGGIALVLGGGVRVELGLVLCVDLVDAVLDDTSVFCFDLLIERLDHTNEVLVATDARGDAGALRKDLGGLPGEVVELIALPVDLAMNGFFLGGGRINAVIQLAVTLVEVVWVLVVLHGDLDGIWCRRQHADDVCGVEIRLLVVPGICVELVLKLDKGLCLFDDDGDLNHFVFGGAIDPRDDVLGDSMRSDVLGRSAKRLAKKFAVTILVLEHDNHMPLAGGVLAGVEDLHAVEVGDVECGFSLALIVDKESAVALEERELVVGLVCDLYLLGLVGKAEVDAEDHALAVGAVVLMLMFIENVQ